VREGIDYSLARPTPAAVVAAGKTFVCRYLARNADKVLTPSEAASLHNAGLGIILNWEDTAQAALKGYSQGKIDAAAAQTQLALLRVPNNIPVYFSCDFNATASQIDTITAYLRGVATVLPVSRIGVYGSYAVIQACVPGFAHYGWQTYAWSAGKISSKAHLYQYKNGVTVAGAACDLDRQLQDDFGVWDMPITDADAATIWACNKNADNESAMGVIMDTKNRIPVNLASFVTTITANITDLMSAVSVVENQIDDIAAGNGVITDDLISKIANKVADVLEARLQA
jgi:hypothetical protein